MNTRMRKQIERASRVVVYCREHPADLTTEQAVVRMLEERLARTEAVDREARANALAEREAIAARIRLRDGIVAGLRLLARTAQAAGREQPGVPITIVIPESRNSQMEFLQGARLAVATATGYEELLGKHGLPPGHLGLMAAELESFARLLAARDDAGQKKVAARRELRAVVSEMWMAVLQLHAAIGFRFRDDPAALRGWATAVDLRIGPRKPPLPGTTPGDPDASRPAA